MLFGYFWDKRLCQRDAGVTCPEKPQRLVMLSPDNIMSNVAGEVVTAFQPRHPSLPLLAHDGDYVKTVEAAHDSGARFLDSGDTLATADVFQQALLAASVACDAVDAVMKGQVERAFCAIRPPGHHANTVRAMGYCIFNNVAIAARHAQQTQDTQRVLIVDWDNDPGNGTQEIFWTDPTVFVLSFHQADLFPAAGVQGLIGAGEGEGFNRNVPFTPGIKKQDYLKAFQHVVGHVAAKFKPEFLIISAGFDAHRCDPRSKMPLVEVDFATMTRILLDETTPFTSGKTVSVLEEGYNLATLQGSVREHCKTLATHSCLAETGAIHAQG